MSETIALKRGTWSRQIADRFRCSLSESLRDWWDSEIWRQHGLGEYRQAISPEELLGPAPECIWPGLMNCELIPLLGNKAGDWLCMRLDGQGRTDQVVQWYHGGGDWIPWGKSLPEAILMDAVIDRLPGPSRRHAEPAENPRPNPDGMQHDRFLCWAFEHLPMTRRELRDAGQDGETLANELLRLGLAELAVRCELILDQLTHSDRGSIVDLLSGQIDSTLLTEWLFDIDRMPREQRKYLEREGIGFEEQQNWDLAFKHAKQVTELAPELAWGWDICGYFHERQGDASQALGFYRRGATCSVFTDQSSRLETHWLSDKFAKFSVSRIHHLHPDSIAESDYFRKLMGPDVRQRRTQVTEYWLRHASDCEQVGEVRRMHDCMVAAAWDVGVDSILVYTTLLERIAEAAAQSDQPAKAELADTHRRCMQDRYGL